MAISQFITKNFKSAWFVNLFEATAFYRSWVYNYPIILLFPAFIVLQRRV